jgi:predicted PurR-regulated permease PerM
MANDESKTDAAVPASSRGVPFRAIFAAAWIAILSGALVLLLVELKKIIFHLVLATFIALVLNPAVTRLQHYMKRGKAIALVVVAVSIGAAGIGASIAAPLASNAVNIAKNAPEYLQEATTGEGPLANLAQKFHLEKQLEKSAPSISKRLSKLSTQVLKVGRSVASAAFTAAIVFILAIFMLVEGPKLVGDFMSALPEDKRASAQRIGHSTTRVVSGYTLGILFMAGLNGLTAGVALAATGTPFVMPLAVWAAVVDILPIVGGLLAIIPAALFAFGHSISAGIIVVVAILVYQQVKNHVLYPVLVGRAVNLNSLLVLIAVLIGAELGHVAGAILAIPIVGTLQTVVVEAARIRSGASVAGESDRAPPAERPEHHGWLARLTARIARRKGV